MIYVSDEVIINVKTCDLTLSEALDKISVYQINNPDRECFLDGDRHQVIGRKVLG